MNIAKELARPFPKACVKWRVGSVNTDKTRCNLLAYIDARDVQSRLDAVVGIGNWQVRFRHDAVYIKGAPATAYVCSLLIKINGEWITKEGTADDTSYEAVKGGESDALKRAAVQWGVGRYLYATTVKWIDGVPKSWEVADKVAEHKLNQTLLGPSSPESGWYVENLMKIITASQIGEIEGLIEETDSHLNKLLGYYHVSELAEMTEVQYTDCVKELNKKLRGHNDN